MNIYYNFFDALKNSKDKTFGIALGGFIFPFYWRVTGHKNTVIFLPGATGSAARPTFQRRNYHALLPYNSVSIFDPTLFMSPELKLGWFQGKRNIFFAEYLAKIIPQLLECLSSNSEDTLFYGTSGGGFGAFHAASAAPDSTVFVGNIQTDISKYHKKSFDLLVSACYPTETPEYVAKNRKKKISILSINAPFRLHYAQNINDKFHYKHHFEPALKAIPRRSKISPTFYTYEDTLSGHAPLPAATELQIIETLFSGKTIERILPNGRLLVI